MNTKAISTVTIKLEIRGPHAVDVVDRVLSSGFIQERINNHHLGTDYAAVQVVSADCRQPMLDPRANPHAYRTTIGAEDDLCFLCRGVEGDPLHGPENALRDVRDLIWPPGFDNPNDEALRARSAVLAAVMDRLAYIKPALLLLAVLAGVGCSSEGPAVCQDGKAWGLVITPCLGAPELATCARETASGSRGAPAVDCTPAPAYQAAVTCVAACPAPPVCDVPVGYTILADACTPTCSVCTAQDSPYRTPAAAHQLPLAGCAPPARADLWCVSSCLECPAVAS